MHFKLISTTAFPLRLVCFGLAALALAFGALVLISPCLADAGDLPVTTSWLANSNSRGGAWDDRTQRFTMDFYGDIAVSKEGFVLCVSTYEEAYSGCITYRNGDLCPHDAPWMMASAVTVTDDYAYYAFSRRGGGLQLLKVKRLSGIRDRWQRLPGRSDRRGGQRSGRRRYYRTGRGRSARPPLRGAAQLGQGLGL